MRFVRIQGGGPAVVSLEEQAPRTRGVAEDGQERCTSWMPNVVRQRTNRNGVRRARGEGPRHALGVAVSANTVPNYDADPLEGSPSPAFPDRTASRILESFSRGSYGVHLHPATPPQIRDCHGYVEEIAPAI